MATRSRRRLVMRIVLWTVIAGAIFMMLIAAFAMWHVFVKEREAKRELDVADSNLADLEARKTDLEAKLKALGTERGIEEVIRERFPVAKPGEEVISIVAPSGNQSGSGTSTPKSLWGIVLSWFSW